MRFTMDGAKVALGSRDPLDAAQLREAIADGSINEFVTWLLVRAGASLSVPAGTVHAIGSGLVVAEPQQRSDVTFRLFNFNRHRERQIESGIAAARAGPAEDQVEPHMLNPGRTLLAADPHLVTERFDLSPGSEWFLRSLRASCLLAIADRAAVEDLKITPGQAFYLDVE